MAWPDDTDLPIGVLAAFGADLTADPGTWTFTDLTDRLFGEPISLRAGRSEGASETSAASGSVLLDNDDGALTPEHAMSEYWPYVDMNTPIWLRLAPEVLADPIVSDAFTRTSAAGWGTADSGQAWETFGVGGSVLAAHATVSAGQGRHFVPTTLAYRACWLPDLSLLDPDVTVEVDTVISDVTGGAIEPGNILLRMQDMNTWYMARVEITASEAVSIQLHHSSGLLASTALPGLVWTGQPLTVRTRILGGEFAAKVWDAAASAEPDWQVEATDTQISAAGSIGIRSGVASGNTNTKPIEFRYDNLVVRAYWELLAGFADQWEPTFVPKGDGTFTSAVRLTLSGILRRLGQGSAPLQSALRRKIVASNPKAYWALEDGKDVTSAQSGMAGGAPLAVLGTVAPQFGDVDGPGGSDSLPDLSSHGVLTGTVSAYTHTGEWQVEHWFRTDTGNSLDFTASVPLQWDTPDGSIVAWDVLLFVGQGALNPGLGNIGLDISGYTAPIGGGQPSEDDRLEVAQSIVVASIPSVQGSWHQLRISATQVGANTNYSAYLNDVLIGSATAVGTIGPVARFTVNPLQGAGAYAGVAGIGLSSVGHVALYDTIVDPGTYQAGLGYPSEQASDRMARLCAEQGVRFVAEAGESEPMGPQRSRTLLELIRECEAADNGILYEEQFGLGFRPRSTRYDLDPTLTIDLETYRYSQGTSPDSVLAPRFDDARTRNEWTISRPAGTPTTAVDSVHQQRTARYDDSAELNVASDAASANHAGWRVHVGTKSSRRYPATPLDLAANPTYLPTWLTLRPGDRVARTNLPPQHPPGQIDIINEGHTATLSPRSWQVAISGGLYAPWAVGTADGDQRVPADGSTLNATLALGGMSLSLASTAANGPWRTSASDPTVFPLDIRVGGEKVTLSAISGSTSPQTATISARGVNGITRAWPAGTEVDVWEPAIAPL